jgi:hypothetical protein
MLSTKSTFDMSTTWNKLSSAKITSLAWHPDKEGILAFGTDGSTSDHHAGLLSMHFVLVSTG